MEELKEVEVEEAVKVGLLRSEMPLVHLPSNMSELSIFIVDWSSISPMLLFSFGLFADLEIFNTVETSLDIRLGS